MKKTVAFLIVLLSWAFFCGNAEEGLYRVAENLRHESVVLPASAPNASHMVLTDYDMLWDDEEQPIGILATYDDTRTKREVDYIEFYDLLGDLVLITWVDRFGIFQVAIDQGLVDEDGVVERFLVVITGGTAL
jgi:hypothetical protein